MTGTRVSYIGPQPARDAPTSVLVDFNGTLVAGGVLCMVNATGTPNFLNSPAAADLSPTSTMLKMVATTPCALLLDIAMVVDSAGALTVYPPQTLIDVKTAGVSPPMMIAGSSYTRNIAPGQGTAWVQAGFQPWLMAGICLNP